MVGQAVVTAPLCPATGSRGLGVPDGEARGTAGGGCPFSVASPSACLRLHVEIHMEPPRAIGRRGVPRLGLYEFPLSTISSHSVGLPR